MTNQEWTQKFQEKVRSLNKPEKRSVEFDDTIESKHPAVGWQEYIRNSFSRFTCSICYHHWGSCKSLVVFHLRLNTVTHKEKVTQQTYKQMCCKCPDAILEEPSVDISTLNDITNKLTERILMKCYEGSQHLPAAETTRRKS